MVEIIQVGIGFLIGAAALIILSPTIMIITKILVGIANYIEDRGEDEDELEC